MAAGDNRAKQSNESRYVNILSGPVLDIHRTNRGLPRADEGGGSCVRCLLEFSPKYWMLQEQGHWPRIDTKCYLNEFNVN